MIADLITSLNSNWSYKQDYSFHYAKEVSTDISKVACIESTLINGHIARIWLITNNYEVKIENIVPVNGKALTPIEYNTILNLFIEDCLKALVQKHSAAVETSSIFAGKEQAAVSEKINRDYSSLNFSLN